MYSTSSATHTAAPRRPLSAFLTALLMACASLAHAGPAISGPSTARVAHGAVFSGAGFAPNSPLTVAIAAPGAVHAHYAAVSAADGTLSYTLVPQTAGTYRLSVLDSAGKVLSATTVHALP